MNISILLDMVADTDGDRVLLTAPAAGDSDGSPHHLTASDLRNRARGVADIVARRGVERLGYVGVNDPMVAVLLFGAAIAGRSYVPLSYRVAPDRLRAMLARTAPALVVVDDADLAERAGGVEGVEVVTRAELEAELAAADPTGEAPPGGDDDAAAVWLFTSGTTGDPKAALLDHQNLSSYVLGTVELLGAEVDEAALVGVPPYHVAGISALLTGTYRGRRSVLLPAFDPDAWVATARAEAVTHTMVVPTMLRRIVDVLERDDVDLPALRHLSYGGGPMPRPVIERAMARLGHVDLVNAYGLTETSSTVCILGPQDHRDAFGASDPGVRARLGSVGRPVPGVEIEVRGPDGSPVAAGEVGEVCVRGEQVSGRYLDQGSVVVDGWFPTRDAGAVDADGFLYLHGRLDDVVVRGGENISPGEVETVLVEHPTVADVAVVGVPDVEWGERLVAVVVAADGEAVDGVELQEWVRSHLRGSRTPDEVVAVDALPYNETGKLLRRQVKADLTPG